MLKRIGSTLIILVLLMKAHLASAEWGVGISMGNTCPYGFQPGSGAINGGDELANLRGQQYMLEQKIERARERLERIDERMRRDREDMRKVLSNRVIDAIAEHRKFQRDRGSYQPCYWDGQAGAVGSSQDNRIQAPRDSNRPAPMRDFCDDQTRNDTWSKWAQNGGEFSDDVCNYKVGNWRGPPEPSASARCRDGLNDYMILMQERQELEQKIAEMDAKIRRLERRQDDIQERIAEGRWCPYCGNQMMGYNNSSTTMGSILPLAAVVAGAGLAIYQQNQQMQMQRQQMILSARYGYAPSQPMFAPPAAPFPGPGAFPGNAYPSFTPGYMGVNNGVYGGVPGAIGQGAFGCQNTSPTGFGSPFGGPPSPFLNSQYPNLFSNPYMNPMMNPAMQNSMLNPGYGPGFMPMLGNGINGFNPMDPFGNMSNPYMMNQQNPFAPGMLPYMSQQNPYMQNPYSMGPYGPGGMPYGLGGPMGPYGPNPYANPYMRYNPYAPGMLPYMGGMPFGNPYAQGYGNPFGGAYGPPMNGYGGPMLANGYPGGFGSPYNMAVSNFYVQIEQLKQQIGRIQNSPIYGGGQPAVLPYPGPSTYYSPTFSSPIYNTPGTPLNPVGNPNIINNR